MTEKDLFSASEILAERDPDLARVLDRLGPPPIWDREPGFPTLVHIILEQQVSLASAKAAFDKLVERIAPLEPAPFLNLDDTELKAIGFSGQKGRYCRELAKAVLGSSLARISHRVLSRGRRGAVHSGVFDLEARLGPPASSVASAMGPDSRRRDDGDVPPSPRSGNEEDGHMPPQPFGRWGSWPISALLSAGRAPRGEKTPLGAMHRRSQQEAGEILGLDLDGLASLADDRIRSELMKVTGIGRWTADIYLLMALGRPDVWPRGDLALLKAVQDIKVLTEPPTAVEFEALGEPWRPWRSVAARMLWNHYLHPPTER